MLRQMERREYQRFPIAQEVTYRVLDQRATAPESGSGTTVDISSKGVLFETGKQLRAGKRVEVSVDWPALLEGGCALKFVAVGRLIRASDKYAAMRIEQYEFRTRRPKAASLPASTKLGGALTV